MPTFLVVRSNPGYRLNQMVFPTPVKSSKNAHRNAALLLFQFMHQRPYHARLNDISLFFGMQ